MYVYKYIFETKEAELNYLYPFMTYSVGEFFERTDGRTDGRTFSKSFLYLPDQDCIYMSIPISIISEIIPHAKS